MSTTLYFSPAGRYAKALRQTVTHNLKDDFEKILIVLNKDALAKYLLGSLCLHKKHLIAFMDDLKDELVLDPHFVNFLKLLIKNNRLDLIEDIYRCFQVMWNEDHNLRIVNITSASVLSKEASEKIEGMLKNYFTQTLNFSYQTNPSLLGGILIESQNLQIDATVVQQINTLNQHLLSL
ncbi:MAG: ATP synthase subunit delta [Holosporales bacterium]